MYSGLHISLDAGDVAEENIVLFHMKFIGSFKKQ